MFWCETYLKKLNNKYFLNDFLEINQNYKYYDAMNKFVNNIKNVIEEVFNDLKMNSEILPYIPSDERNELSDIIIGLNKFCEFMRSSISSASSCINLLKLSDSRAKRKSSASINEIERGVRIIKNGGKINISGSDRVNLIEKSVKYDTNYACGKNIKNIAFIGEVLNGKDKNFLSDIWNKYNKIFAFRFCTYIILY